MRIRAVGHACLEIEAGGLRLLTDPWWEGPAFGGLWRPFPAPQPAGLSSRPIDYLFLSRPRGDHLHVPTLRTLRHADTVLVPELVRGSMAPPLRDGLGFCDVVELRHGRTTTLRRGLRATCYVAVDASVLVLEDGDRVLVHAGSALHAAAPAVVAHLCHLLASRHTAIDTLFLGHAGASWLPDGLRLPGKDDRHAARARARHLADTFAEITRRLRPRLACALPHAPLHVNPESRWVNDVRFEVATPEAAFRARARGLGTRAHLLAPGDVVDGLELHAADEPRASRAALEEALHVAGLGPAPYDEPAVRALLARLDARLHVGAARLAGRPPFDILLRFRDAPGLTACARFDGARARVEAKPSRQADAELSLPAAVLDHALSITDGVDAITVAHGAVATLPRLAALGRVEDLLSVLSPRPAGGGPRVAGVVWSQRWPLALAAGTRWRILPPVHELQALASAPAGPAA